MSFANFDEIRKICCEYEEDQAVRVMNPVDHLELFPEGHMWEERLKRYDLFADREKNLPLPRLIPEQDEAIYMVRYGQLV